jgi:hypothetical protein
MKNDEYQKIPVNALIEREIIFTEMWIDVHWEGTQLTSYFIDIFEHYYPGDHWVYNIFWKIPFYAPNG